MWRIALAERHQIDVVPMVVQDHGQAGLPALGDLRLQQYRQAFTPGKMQAVAIHGRLLMLKIGSNSHSIRVRRSLTISASSSMPGRSATASP